MQHIQTILSILLPLFIGFCFKLPKDYLRAVDRLLSLLVYVILLFIGTTLAQTPNLTREMGNIILYSALLFGLLMICNAAVLMWFDRRFAYAFQGNQHARAKLSVADSAKQIGILLTGLLLGKTLPSAWLPPEKMGQYALMVLIFAVGIQLRGNGISFRSVLLNRHGLWLSVWFMLSCALAGLLFALILPEVSFSKGLAMASGYGWYSLSGIVMTQAYGATWGSVAVFNDLAREFFALVFIPLLMRRFPSTAIGVGGATSLDFTLPIIQKSGGLAAVPVAISFGFIVNLTAPVLMVLLSAVK